MTRRHAKGHISTANMDTMVTIIINETKKLYVGREREELMYNHAHKKLMELMWS